LLLEITCFWFSAEYSIYHDNNAICLLTRLN
jgi:hypothetical protein